MVRIVVNVNKKDVVLHYSTGEVFPKLDGRLVSVEVSGKELRRYAEVKEMPLQSTDASVSWFGRHAGRVIRDLREVFSV